MRIKVKGVLEDKFVDDLDSDELRRMLSSLYQTRLMLISTAQNLKSKHAVDRRLSALSRIAADLVVVRLELENRGAPVPDLFATQFVERAQRLLSPEVFKRIADGV